MTGFLQRHRIALLLGGLAAIALGLCVTSVPETSQAVVLRMGQPVRVINRWTPNGAPGGGGLIAHLPFVEQVAWVDRGLVSVTAERQPVRSADQFPLLTDIAATYRVYDPVRLVNEAGSTDKASERLRSMIGALAQEQLGAADANALVQPGGGGTLASFRAALDKRARTIGAQVVDVRLTATALPEGELQQAYERMEADRARLAIEEADAGQRDAERIFAEGQAGAARILGASAGKDPDFYDFYRAMLSYEMVFANAANKGTTTIILGPDSEYLKQFRGH